MTQTASISSRNKKKFLKKAFKAFGTSEGRDVKTCNNPPLPIPEKRDENEQGC